MAFISDPAFIATVGLILFFVVLFYFKVPGSLGSRLDDRAQKIADELEDARRMREEAQELLASYQRRQREAETEAETIVSQAKKEAKRIREQARKDLEDRLERRAVMAEAKIAQAEKQAAAEVRAAAADQAVAAAEALIRDKLDEKGRDAILKSSLSDLEKRLN
ncbi:MAG: F0F1 ATP synthase subunit B [Euryhalocaulis sp.]|uniref:F0F1 ATP synthase subunit B n=1 Tax=Euryhalocaulis sp. TaxID=2744307 RepID=UPI00179B7A86|nr:F0F1 ATP synthase subunit B [Euryhalocaulis sp.]MBA4802596.1 F0F1 ATP synthase subunit B [Euryhalocaulis sp.]